MEHVSVIQLLDSRASYSSFEDEEIATTVLSSTLAEKCSELIRRLGYSGINRFAELMEKNPRSDPSKVLFYLLNKTEVNWILTELMNPYALEEMETFSQFEIITGDFAEDLQQAIDEKYSSTLDSIRQFVLYPDEFPVKRIIHAYINHMWREHGEDYENRLNMVLFLVNCYLTHTAIRRESLSHAGFSYDPISFIPDWRMSVSGVLRLRILPKPHKTFVFGCAHRDDLVFVRTETGLFLKYNFDGETLYWQLYFEFQNEERDVSRLISSMTETRSVHVPSYKYFVEHETSVEPESKTETD